MAKILMVQGTMSNVGKSLVVAGLCRIFSRAGYKVAPFKSQNMALNSFITEEGFEMGRAQVMQAEACGIKPRVEMNPILLKPTDDKGSQVIVMGKAVGNMTAKDYYKNKLSFLPCIKSAFAALEKDFDIIVIEGAGSPAEINLKENDIVNMGIAKLFKAPVLLVGDIDRGGVFAQLLGTIDLLEEEEKDHIKAMVINKFRGDKAILEPGLKMLEERAKKPVIGVIPYVNCDIDDEDSLTERFTRGENTGLIDIAVIRLPRISNFTDFNPFERIEGVSLRYVNSAYDLKNPDMVIIPGTKSTIGDMLWLRESGLEAKILQLASQNTPVFGICGGYQLLGEIITDSTGAEAFGEVKGTGLLPVATTFEAEKTTTQVKGKIIYTEGIFSSLTGCSFKGYEIHMGVSKILYNGKNMTSIENIGNDSLASEKYEGANRGNVYGSYVHGLFDNESITNGIITALMNKKGLSAENIKAFDVDEYKNKQYDILADALEQGLNMNEVYKILQNGME